MLDNRMKFFPTIAFLQHGLNKHQTVVPVINCNKIFCSQYQRQDNRIKNLEKQTRNSSSNDGSHLLLMTSRKIAKKLNIKYERKY